MSTPIYFYKAKNLSNLKADSIVAVKNDNESAFSLYVTDRSGIPYPLKGLQNNIIITNTDGNLQITSSSTSTNINLSSSILATINSALQNGDNISELVNDVGYLTTFTEIDPIFQASEASLFISGDKLKLDGIEDGAEVNNISDANAIDLTDGGDTSLHNHDSRYYTEIEADNKYVPYTGATTNVDLGEYQLKAGQLEFDQTPTGTFTTGKVRWNDSDGTIEVMLKGGNVTLQVGQESLIRIVNKTATNLTEAGYQAVYISGAQGQRLKVDLALATSDLTSAGTIGIVTENIAVNQEGFVTSNGLVRGINTTGSLQGETWVDGDMLYLSPTVAGRITNIKPIAPFHTVVIGVCVHAHATQGSIFVKVDNGYELNELHNVLISEVLNNDLLVYESSSSIWKNKSIGTVLGYTPENSANKQNDLTIDGTGIKYPTVDAVNTIDLQKVVNVGGYAEVDGGSSYATILGGTAYDREVRLNIEDSVGNYSKLSIFNDSVEMEGSNEVSVSGVIIEDGNLSISKQMKSLGSNSTSIYIEDPLATTTLNFPAKTIAGTYTLATTDDVVDLTNAQTIFGEKTFNDNVLAEKLIRIRDSDLSGYGEFQNNLDALEYKSASGQLRLGVNSNGIIFGEGDQCSLSTALLTDDRSILIPDVSGNLAIISQTITNGVTDKSPSEDAVFDAIDGVVKTIITDTPTSTNTGGVSEVLMHTYKIAGGKLPSSCMPNLKLMVSKIGTSGNVILKIKVNSVNNFATSVLIGSVQASASNLAFIFNRNFSLSDGVISFSNPTSLATDESFSTSAISSTPLNTLVEQYIFVSLQNSSAGDTTSIKSIKLVN